MQRDEQIALIEDDANWESEQDRKTQSSVVLGVLIVLGTAAGSIAFVATALQKLLGVH